MLNWATEMLIGSAAHVQRVDHFLGYWNSQSIGQSFANRLIVARPFLFLRPLLSLAREMLIASAAGVPTAVIPPMLSRGVPSQLAASAAVRFLNLDSSTLPTAVGRPAGRANIW